MKLHFGGRGRNNFRRQRRAGGRPLQNLTTPLSKGEPRTESRPPAGATAGPQSRGAPETPQNHLREKSKFASRFNDESVVQSLPQKYFCLRKSEIMHIYRPSRL